MGRYPSSVHAQFGCSFEHALDSGKCFILTLVPHAMIGSLFQSPVPLAPEIGVESSGEGATSAVCVNDKLVRLYEVDLANVVGHGSVRSVLQPSRR